MGEPSESLATRLVLQFLRRPPHQIRSRALVTAVITAFEEAVARVDGSDDEVTVEAVLERAGVGVSSFYQYFGDKRSLLGAFVGHLTDRNFRQLVEALDAADHANLKEVIEDVASHVVRTYCDRPSVTRAAIATIGRLGLLREVRVERDRFAGEMARVAQRFYPDTPRADLVRSMRILSDAIIGILTAELDRTGAPDLATLSDEIVQLATALLAERHGSPAVAGQIERNA